MSDEIRQQTLELRQKIQQLKANIQQTDRNRFQAVQEGKRAHLTTEEIAPLSDSVPVYRSVGKAYVLSSRSELLSELESTARATGEEGRRLEALRERLGESLKQAEGELSEVVRAAAAQ